MKLDTIKNYNNAQSFGAIELPKLVGSHKLNYKTVSKIVNNYAPEDKIKICRGVVEDCKGSRIFDYVLTSFDSIKEKEIFKRLSNLSKKIKIVADDVAENNTEIFDTAERQFEETQRDLIEDGPVNNHTVKERIRQNILSPEKSKFEKFMVYVKEKKPIDDVIIDAIRWKCNLTGVEKVQEDGYRGGPLFEHLDALSPFKSAGIDTIVDLSHSPSYYKNECEKLGLKHFAMTIDEKFWEQPAFRTIYLFLDLEEKRLGNKFNAQKSEEFFNKLSREFIEKDLKNFIDVMNEGHYYVHCANGLYKTDHALVLDYLFNPKCKLVKIPKIDYGTSCRMEWLYEKFGAKDKTNYAWNEEFDRNFQKRLDSVIED